MPFEGSGSITISENIVKIFKVEWWRHCITSVSFYSFRFAFRFAECHVGTVDQLRRKWSATSSSRFQRGRRKFSSRSGHCCVVSFPICHSAFSSSSSEISRLPSSGPQANWNGLPPLLCFLPKLLYRYVLLRPRKGPLLLAIKLIRRNFMSS